jgi:putative flippase GtrA
LPILVLRATDCLLIAYSSDNKMTSEFLKFLMTGGLAALANLASRYALNLVMPFEAAVVAAYLIGMTTAYILARLFVFQRSGRSVASEVRRFAIVNVVALVIVWLVSVGLARLLFPAVGFTWHADDIAHLIGVLSTAVSSYFGHRLYTFAQRTT